MILHNKRLDHTVLWAEYDAHTNQITLISEQGQLQNLGITPNPAELTNLQTSKEVTLAFIPDNAITSIRTVSLLIRMI